MSISHNEEWFGRAALAPDTPVTAGEYGTWTLTYTAGRYGIDNTGSVLVCWKFASDWGRPQTDDPEAENFLTTTTNARCTVKARYVFKGHIRPWYHVVWVDVLDGDVAPGEEIRLTFGDTSGGSPGHRAQTAVEDGSVWQVFVDSLNTRRFVPLERCPKVRIVSGPVAKVEAVVPSQALAGKSTWMVLRAFDIWGNVAESFTGEFAIRCECMGDDALTSVPVRKQDRGVRRVDDIVFPEPGISRLCVINENGEHVAVSNPCEVVKRQPRRARFWGDPHGQSGEALGLGAVRDYYGYARDVAAIDFVSNQGNDFDIHDAGWNAICAATKEYHEPGRFIPFLGYEWSGNSCAGGDHNVIFLGDDERIRRSSHLNVTDGGDTSSDCYPVTELYDVFSGRDDVLVIPHVGGRYADLSFHDPELEPLIEIYSGWGLFEWFLNDALARGHRVGFVAGSDDHKCRPGAAQPGTRVFGVLGGLTCVRAEELTRESVFAALKQRRCYATSGARILLDVSCGRRGMGESFEVRKPVALDVHAVGTAGLESVEIMRFDQGDTEAKVVYSHPINPRASLSNKVKIAWSGMRQIPRYFQTVWDGSLSVDTGRIVSAEPYAFDTPLESITEHRERRIRWKSQTTGDEDGVIVELDVPAKAVLTFKTEPVTVDMPLMDIGREPVTVAAGGVGQRVTFRRVPAVASPDEVVFGWRDTAPVEGECAYFVKITQEDGHVAYSSPMYITRSR